MESLKNIGTDDKPCVQYVYRRTFLKSETRWKRDGMLFFRMISTYRRILSHKYKFFQANVFNDFIYF